MEIEREDSAPVGVFTLRLANGELESVDAASLVRVSEYFAGLVQSGMMESRSGMVDLTEYTRADLQPLWNFLLLTSEVPDDAELALRFTLRRAGLTPSNVENVACFADKYQIEILREVSEAAIIHWLSHDTAANYYNFSHIFEHFTRLKRATRRYILYYFHSMSVAQLAVLPKGRLLNLLLQEGLNTGDRGERCVIDFIFAWATHTGATDQEIIEMLYASISWVTTGEADVGYACGIAEKNGRTAVLPVLQAYLEKRKKTYDETPGMFNYGPRRRGVPYAPVFLYGNKREIADEEEHPSNEFYHVDSESYTVRRLPDAPFGEAPTGISLCTDGPYLYQSGGVLDPESPNERWCLDVWRFNGLSEHWERLSDLPKPRRDHFSCVMQNSLYIAGGIVRNHPSEPKQVSMMKQDLTTRTWTDCASLPVPYADHRNIVPCVLFQNTLYMFPTYHTIFRYDAAEDEWHPLVNVRVHETFRQEAGFNPATAARTDWRAIVDRLRPRVAEVFAHDNNLRGQVEELLGLPVDQVGPEVVHLLRRFCMRMELRNNREMVRELTEEMLDLIDAYMTSHRRVMSRRSDAGSLYHLTEANCLFATKNNIYFTTPKRISHNPAGLAEGALNVLNKLNERTNLALYRLELNLKPRRAPPEKLRSKRVQFIMRPPKACGPDTHMDSDSKSKDESSKQRQKRSKAVPEPMLMARACSSRRYMQKSHLISLSGPGSDTDSSADLDTDELDDLMLLADVDADQPGPSSGRRASRGPSGYVFKTHRGPRANPLLKIDLQVCVLLYNPTCVVNVYEFELRETPTRSFVFEAPNQSSLLFWLQQLQEKRRFLRTNRSIRSPGQKRKVEPGSIPDDPAPTPPGLPDYSELNASLPSVHQVVTELPSPHNTVHRQTSQFFLASDADAMAESSSSNLKLSRAQLERLKKNKKCMNCNEILSLLEKSAELCGDYRDENEAARNLIDVLKNSLVVYKSQIETLQSLGLAIPDNDLINFDSGSGEQAGPSEQQQLGRDKLMEKLLEKDKLIAEMHRKQEEDELRMQELELLSDPNNTSRRASIFQEEGGGSPSESPSKKSAGDENDIVNAYRAQNQFLNKEVLELHGILGGADNQQHALQMAASDIEAKYLQLKSKYELLINHCRSSEKTFNHLAASESSEDEVLSAIMQDADSVLQRDPVSTCDTLGFYNQEPTSNRLESVLQDASRYLHLSATNQASNSDSYITWLGQWDEFLTANLKGVRRFVLPPTPELKRLVRMSIPHSYRSTMWKCFVMQQAQRTTQEVGSGYFDSLLKINDGREVIDAALRQIDLDLARTLPGNRYFDGSDPQKMEKLRRVLQAYRWHNREVGYCQGLNRLAAIALLYLSEEDAFWALVAIIDYIQPKGYYDRSMIAAQVDQRVLKELVAEKLPRVYRTVLDNDVELSQFTLNWFLTIFVDTVPHETYLAIWDCYLFEGSKVLFRFAIAALKLFETQICACNSTASTLTCLNNIGRSLDDFKKLSQIAFNDINPFSMKMIDMKRASHKQQVLQEMDSFAEMRSRLHSVSDSAETAQEARMSGELRRVKTSKD